MAYAPYSTRPLATFGAGFSLPALQPEGLVQAGVGQNVTFSRLPSGEWLARTRVRSDGDDLGDKGRANSPP